MASWPTADDVKRRVSITRDSDGVNADVQLALGAAIETVEMDAAAWLAGAFPAADASDPLTPREPDARLASAAMVLAVSCYKAPDAPYGVAGVFDVAAIAVRDQHPTYVELLRGKRANHGIA
jgi:hypothetical protein